jgi:hypothetical protein
VSDLLDGEDCDSKIQDFSPWSVSCYEMIEYGLLITLFKGFPFM